MAEAAPDDEVIIFYEEGKGGEQYRKKNKFPDALLRKAKNALRSCERGFGKFVSFVMQRVRYSLTTLDRLTPEISE